MIEQICDNSFLSRQSNLINVFPLVGGKELEDAVKPIMGSERLHADKMYFSWLDFDSEIGIIEEIYGASWTQKGFTVQKLLVVPADKRLCALSRNCYQGCGCAAGFHSYGYRGKDVRYYPYMPEFDFSAIDVSKISRHELYGFERIVHLDDSLKYCAYKSGNGIYAIDYIGLYKKYPICEMLMKLNIKRMWSEKALEFITANKDFQKWLFRNADKVSEMAFHTARNAFRKNPGGDPEDYRKSLMFRIEAGKEASFENKAVYKKALKHATQERLYAYIREKGMGKEAYGDYLTACDWLRLDFADTKVLFPKDFHALHDDYTAQYAEYTKDVEVKKHLQLSAQMLKTAEKFSFLGAFKDGSYSVVVARSKGDLISEGERLHHCVGRMDYDRRQADGKSVICFIRRNGELDSPFVTAEVKVGDSRLSISQCYGDNDRVVHEVDGFVDSWMKFSNREYKKIKKGA
jgi:hypothetical protein